jgi:ankyrin repeat protein
MHNKQLYEQYKNLDKNRLNIEFQWACSGGDLELVKYFLTSTDLKTHADISSSSNVGFMQACKNGHLDVVKYLLTSKDLKKHVDIHARNDEIFTLTCFTGKLDVIKYLLTSPELTEHIDIHTNKDGGFLRACEGNQYNVLQYFIFDLNIERTEAIDKYLKEKPNKKVEDFFNLRNLNNELKESLPSHPTNNSKSKI